MRIIKQISFGLTALPLWGAAGFMVLFGLESVMMSSYPLDIRILFATASILLMLACLSFAWDLTLRAIPALRRRLVAINFLR